MEKDSKVLINFHGEVPTSPVEVILREGEAPKALDQLPIMQPEKINLSGVIDLPYKWLEKRIDTIDQKRANIVVDREKMKITLTINEDEFYTKNTLSGSVQFSEVYEKFGINNESVGWDPNKLGQFLRLNRGVFQNKETCMKMVSNLKNFTAKANTEIQKHRDPSGSTADVYRSQVESNLPKSFTVELQIFKGTEKQLIEVEFDHYVMDGKVYLQLVSPGANEITQAYRDTCIDNVLNDIKEIAPEIAILEV